MKVNVSYPATGAQKLVEIEDEKRMRPFYEKRMGQEVEGDSLGDEWKGYVFRISGGNDKQGFPMKQGVLTNGRVRLLLSKGHSCYRPRRDGERRRKSVRGCIVDSNLSVLALVVIKRGPTEIPGLTDVNIPRRLGPKRASKIRKLFNLSKEDDVRHYVIKRALPKKPGKKLKYASPKIQRLVTPAVLQHKRRRLALKKKRRVAAKEAKESYEKMLAIRYKELKERKAAQSSSTRRGSSRRKSSGGKAKSGKPAPAKKTSVAKKPAAKDAKKTAAPAKKTSVSKKPAAKDAKKPAKKESRAVTANTKTSVKAATMKKTKK